MKSIHIHLRVRAIFIAMFSIVFVPSFSQSKGVDWIHGLGGNSGSLEEVATFYQNSRPITNPTRNSYPTGNGITSMATPVQAQTGGANRLA